MVEPQFEHSSLASVPRSQLLYFTASIVVESKEMEEILLTIFKGILSRRFPLGLEESDGMCHGVKRAL